MALTLTRQKAAAQVTPNVGPSKGDMSARELYIVGARLLGLYLMALGIATVPGIGAAYEAATNSNSPHPGQYAVAAGLQAALFIIVGAILLLRYRLAAGGGPVEASPEPALRVGIQLLGVYFAVSGVISMIGAVGETLVIASSWSFHFSQIAPSLLYAIVGLFLALRASFVVGLLQPSPLEPPN